MHVQMENTYLARCLCCSCTACSALATSTLQELRCCKLVVACYRAPTSMRLWSCEWWPPHCCDVMLPFGAVVMTCVQGLPPQWRPRPENSISNSCWPCEPAQPALTSCIALHLHAGWKLLLCFYTYLIHLMCTLKAKLIKDKDLGHVS